MSTAMARLFDPDVSHDAAAMQHPAACERDILLALACRADLGSCHDPTGLELWESMDARREPGTVVSALSRLHREGLVEVTGKRKPEGRRAAARTYRISFTGRALLRSNSRP